MNSFKMQTRICTAVYRRAELSADRSSGSSPTSICCPLWEERVRMERTVLLTRTRSVSVHRPLIFRRALAHFQPAAPPQSQSIVVENNWTIPQWRHSSTKSAGLQSTPLIWVGTTWRKFHLNWVPWSNCLGWASKPIRSRPLAPLICRRSSLPWSNWISRPIQFRPSPPVLFPVSSKKKTNFISCFVDSNLWHFFSFVSYFLQPNSPPVQRSFWLRILWRRCHKTPLNLFLRISSKTTTRPATRSSPSTERVSALSLSNPHRRLHRVIDQLLLLIDRDWIVFISSPGCSVHHFVSVYYYYLTSNQFTCWCELCNQADDEI